MATRIVDRQLPPGTRPPSQYQRVKESLVFELRRAMSLPQTPAAHAILRLLFGGPIGRVAAIAVGLDRAIKSGGIAAGARWALPHFVAGFSATGAEIIPPRGPLLIVSNHPAGTDIGVITAYVQRSDYRLIMGQVPVYSHLPSFSSYAIMSPVLSDTFGRMQTVRRSLRHLKSGGLLVTFPRGGIEPDPACMPDPDVDFHIWSRSLELFLREVPETQVVVSIVSGVVEPLLLNHPLTWFRKRRADRQRLSLMVQFMRQAWTGREVFGLRPRVTFGELLSGATHPHMLAEVTRAARRTLERHMAGASA